MDRSFDPHNCWRGICQLSNKDTPAKASDVKSRVDEALEKNGVSAELENPRQRKGITGIKEINSKAFLGLTLYAVWPLHVGRRLFLSMLLIRGLHFARVEVRWRHFLELERLGSAV